MSLWKICIWLDIFGGEIEITNIGRYSFSGFKIDKEMVYVLEENNYFRKGIVDEIKEELDREGFEKAKYQKFLIYTYPD